MNRIQLMNTEEANVGPAVMVVRTHRSGGIPEKRSHNSPRRHSGSPLRTSSRVLEVRYMHTPRPNSKKWIFHDSSFIFSLAWKKREREGEGRVFPKQSEPTSERFVIGHTNQSVFVSFFIIGL